jgi:hypothetical protein
VFPGMSEIPEGGMPAAQTRSCIRNYFEGCLIGLVCHSSGMHATDNPKWKARICSPVRDRTRGALMKLPTSVLTIPRARTLPLSEM